MTTRLLALTAVLASAAFGQATLFQDLDSPVPLLAVPVETMGDLDNDGDVDIISPNGVFANDGHGRFAQVLTGSSLAFFSMRTILADVNGDGLPDVVSIPWTGGTGGMIRIDLNLGYMIFAGPVAGLPTVANAYNLAAGDVDNDGDPDILIGEMSYFSYTIPSLWLNNGTGGFTSTPIPAPLLGIGPMFLRDLDGDGDLDASFGGNAGGPIGNLTIATNAGGVFTFAPSPLWSTSIVMYDMGNFDGNSYPDFVVSGPAGTAIILGSASGFAAPVVSAAPAYSGVLVPIDLNGDGIDELAEHSSFGVAGGVTVYAVGAGGALGPATQSLPGLLLAPGVSPETAQDLDGDGDRDTIGWGAGGATALMNNGAGSLVAVGGRTSGVYVPSLKAGDLDGNGQQDLIGLHWLSQTASSIVTAFNDGSGFYAQGPAVPFVALGLPLQYSLHPFDGDGDGDSDLYVARNSAVPQSFNPHDFVYASTGGVLSLVATIAIPGATSAFKAADLDGDGDQDVILGRREPTTNGATGITGPMVLLANLGGVGLSPPIPFGTSNHATYDVEVGDFDGNSLLDVFQVNSLPPGAQGTPDPCVLWLNTGSGFTEHLQSMSGFFAAAADLNGDGLTDVVLDSQVWFAAAGGTLVPGPLLPSALLGPPILADLDEDGDLDLLEPSATVFFNGGGGNFGAPVSYLPRGGFPPDYPETYDSAVADVDRDGDLDILAPGPHIFSNTIRQIARGSVARPGRPASIDLYGAPGGSWFLWGSNGTTSLPFPPWGTVLIDPASAQMGAIGTFAGPTSPVAGTASLSVLVPFNPALVGWTSYWQSIDIVQTRLTNRLAITVMSF